MPSLLEMLFFLEGLVVAKRGEPRFGAAKRLCVFAPLSSPRISKSPHKPLAMVEMAELSF